MSRKAPYSYQKNRFRYLMALGASQDWLCYYCGILMVIPGIGDMEPKTATIDHKKPVSAGGAYELDNLVACCSLCNSKKNKHKSHDEFLLIMSAARKANGGAI